MWASKPTGQPSSHPSSQPASHGLHALLCCSYVCICGGLWFVSPSISACPASHVDLLVAHILCDEPLHETESRVKIIIESKKSSDKILRVGEALWENYAGAPGGSERLSCKRPARRSPSLKVRVASHLRDAAQSCW